MSNLAAFGAVVLGQTLDEDGAFPGECHDLWLKYLYALGGIPGDGWAPGEGHTVNVFHGFPDARPGLASLFTRHDGVAGIRAGDVAFWNICPDYPGSHVAIALGPESGWMLPTLTQNPGPVRRADLTISGFAGYLRPIAPLDQPNHAAKHAAPRAWEDDMKHFGGASTRKAPQTIPAGARTRLAWSDAPTGGESIAGGQCDIVGLVATVRLKGRPGTRAQIGAYRETGRSDPNRLDLLGPRVTFDSLGLAQAQIMISLPLAAADRIRLTVHTAKDTGPVVVEGVTWAGYAR